MNKADLVNSVSAQTGETKTVVSSIVDATIKTIIDSVVDGKKVGSMRDGEVFGEMALILKQNRSATIISNQSTELISITTTPKLVDK